MPQVAAGAAIVGAGIGIYGALSSASDQAGLDNERAQIAHEQAQEIAAREAANEALKDQQATRQQLQFGASFAASGKAGVGIGSQLQIKNQEETQNMISNREAMFQENMLNQQAGIDTTLANETETAGTISTGLGGLGAAAKIASPSFSGGGNQGLGAYPTGKTTG